MWKVFSYPTYLQKWICSSALGQMKEGRDKGTVSSTLFLPGILKHWTPFSFTLPVSIKLMFIRPFGHHAVSLGSVIFFFLLESASLSFPFIADLFGPFAIMDIFDNLMNTIDWELNFTCLFGGFTGP